MTTTKIGDGRMDSSSMPSPPPPPLPLPEQPPLQKTSQQLCQTTNNRPEQAQSKSQPPQSSSSPSSSSSSSQLLLLISFFGLGSSAWILVNALYAEIPLIVINFGYDYTIISKITLCITLSSISTFLWTLVVVPILDSKTTKTTTTTTTTKRQRRPSTTVIGIILNLLIGIGVALGVTLSTNATSELSSLLVISVCSGIVGSMSLVLYFPHAATTTATTTTTPSLSSSSEEQTGSGGQHASAALKQTTAMASGTAVANLFLGVLAIIQFNPPNDGGGDDGVLFDLQSYFGIITAMFVLATLGFVGTLVFGNSTVANGKNENEIDGDNEMDPEAGIHPPTDVASPHDHHYDATTKTTWNNEEEIEMEPVHDDEVEDIEATTTTTSTAKYNQEQVNHRKNGSAVATAAGNDVDFDDTGSDEPLMSASGSKSTLTNYNLHRNHGTMTTSTKSMTTTTQQPKPLPGPKDRSNSGGSSNSSPVVDDTMTTYISPSSPSLLLSSSYSYIVSFWMVSKQYVTLNAAQCILNCMTFFLPGVVPFSVQHYDNSQRALHYLTVTQLLAQTFGIVLSGYYQNRHVWIQLCLFVILWIPTVALSVVNDTDFQTVQQHSAVPITINAILQFLYGYSSTTFFHLIHEEAAKKQQQDEVAHSAATATKGHDPHAASRVLGTWNQFGAMIGSLIAYFLVESGVIH